MQILPCIYGAWSGTTIWSALAAAMDSGVACKGYLMLPPIGDLK